MASIKISTQEPDEAKQLLTRSLEFWWYPLQGPSPGDDNDDNDDDMNVAPDADLFVGMPPYEFRINTVKLLLEVGEPLLAAEIAAALQEEDEKIMQVCNIKIVMFSHVSHCFYESCMLAMCPTSVAVLDAHHLSA